MTSLTLFIEVKGDYKAWVGQGKCCGSDSINSELKLRNMTKKKQVCVILQTLMPLYRSSKCLQDSMIYKLHININHNMIFEGFCLTI